MKKLVMLLLFAALSCSKQPYIDKSPSFDINVNTLTDVELSEIDNFSVISWTVKPADKGFINSITVANRNKFEAFECSYRSRIDYWTKDAGSSIQFKTFITSNNVRKQIIAILQNVKLEDSLETLCILHNQILHRMIDVQFKSNTLYVVEMNGDCIRKEATQ